MVVAGGVLVVCWWCAGGVLGLKNLVSIYMYMKYERTKLITIQDPYTEPAGSQEPARKCKFQMAVYMLKLSRTEILSTVPCSKFRGASFIFFQFLS